MDKIVALCKRRGFIFQSSEIYGGLASTYDYGHYGVLLKNNVKDEWWRAMVQERDDIVALDAAILMHPRTWEASGHLEGFTDPLVQCLGECKRRWREDHLREAQPEGELSCPECGGELSEPRNFNLMFETHMGPVQDEGSRSTCAPRPPRASSSTSRTCCSSRARSRRSASRRSASRSATRSRPATSSSARASSSRWRWSSSCRPPRRRSGTSTGWRSACAGTPTSASGPTTCGCARTTPTSCRTTRAPPRTSSTSSRWAGRSSRASPTAATSTSPSTRSSRARSSSTSTPAPASATCRT